MKGLMILADGFEDVEGIAVIDVLKRANINLTIVTLKNKDMITTSHGLKLNVTKSLKDVDYEKFDFLIIPGGAAVFNELDGNLKVNEIIKHFCDKKKLVCAICAAPMLIGKLGYFKDLEYTCFPGCNDGIIGGTLVDKPLVHTQNFILARSMYYANDFALEIVSEILGNEKACEIALQIKGL